jgi:hypothetical protein
MDCSYQSFSCFLTADWIRCLQFACANPNYLLYYCQSVCVCVCPWLCVCVRPPACVCVCARGCVCVGVAVCVPAGLCVWSLYSLFYLFMEPSYQSWLFSDFEASLSLLWTVWALMKGLCVPDVTRPVVVAILYLSCRCDVRMYRSYAGVVTHGLPLRGWSAVRPVSL